MPKKQTSSSQDNQNLLQAVEKTNRLLAKQNSFKRNFALSIVQGMGSALGATLVAGIVIAIIYQLLVSLNALPFFQDLLPSSAADQFLQYTGGASPSSQEN